MKVALVEAAGPIVFKLRNRGVVVVDESTFSLREQRQMVTALRALNEYVKAETGSELGEADFIVGSLWVVLRRTEPGLEIAALWEDCTVGELASGEPHDDPSTVEDDSPEA